MPVNILLVGNYIPEKQHSMLGFAELLESGLRRAGHRVRVAHPPYVFGRIGEWMPRMQKWLAYLDKLFLFPPLLRGNISQVDIVHICDHSSALYIPWARSKPYVVTCHDLLAIRGSLGEATDCPASMTGKWLQQWILRGLSRADAIACASCTTLDDVTRLLPGPRRTTVVPLALRDNLPRLSASESAVRLRSIPGLDPDKPIVLHVGSSHARKNREGLIRIFARAIQHLDAQLVVAGKPLTASQRRLATELRVSDRIVEAREVSNHLLSALYSKAIAFVFPSKFEGFGWPIVEAQACGCPVVCSDRAPFPEVGGAGALFFDVNDETGFAHAIVRLANDSEFRSALIEKGLQNLWRYRPDIMISRYISLYEQVLSAQENTACAAARV
jgi:glycosyltransferase involved in cell wall biosynthesis